MIRAIVFSVSIASLILFGLGIFYLMWAILCYGLNLGPLWASVVFFCLICVSQMIIYVDEDAAQRDASLKKAGEPK